MRTVMVLATILAMLCIIGCREGPEPTTSAAPPPIPAPSPEGASAQASPTEAEGAPSPQDLARALRQILTDEDYGLLAGFCAPGEKLALEIDELPGDWEAVEVDADCGALVEGEGAPAEVGEALDALHSAFTKHPESVSEMAISDELDAGSQMISWSAPASGIAVRITGVPRDDRWYAKRIWLQIWE